MIKAASPRSPIVNRPKKSPELNEGKVVSSTLLMAEPAPRLQSSKSKRDIREGFKLKNNQRDSAQLSKRSEDSSQPNLIQGKLDKPNNSFLAIMPQAFLSSEHKTSAPKHHRNSKSLY
jgi:hypothetical protein